MSEPIDKQLYEDVKKMANTVFKSPTGIYRPKLFKDIDKDVIKRVNKQKQTLRNKGNIRF